MTTDSGTESPWEIGEERTYHGEIVRVAHTTHRPPSGMRSVMREVLSRA